MEAQSADNMALVINAIAILVSLATLALIALATVRLYRKAHVPGSGNMLAALAGCIGGIPVFMAYLVVMGEEASRTAEDAFNLYEVACVAFGAWGYWRVSKSVADRANKDD